MRTTKELAALVEAAPDWEPQVDIHLGYRGAGDACEATWRAEVEAKEPVGVGLWQDPDADAQGCALGALLGALDRTTLRHLIAKADEADALRPLAELGALVLGPNDLPGLINALLRLCTHAQLGEVVVPRRAGEWERELWVVAEWTARTMPGFGIVGRVRPGGDGEGAWVALSWRIEGQHVGPSTRTEHPTRAEAEAAVDDRLRADGVVLP